MTKKEDSSYSNFECARRIRSLEHVVVEFSARVRKRGDLSLSLVSPAGTRTRVLPSRRFDYSR